MIYARTHRQKPSIAYHALNRSDTDNSAGVAYSFTFNAAADFTNMKRGPNSRLLVHGMATENGTGSSGDLSLTVNGVPATRLVQAIDFTTGGHRQHAAFFLAQPPQRIDELVFALTLNLNARHGFVAFYSVENLIEPDEAFDTLGLAGTSGALDIPENGVFAAAIGESVLTSFTWTATLGVSITEAYDHLHDAIYTTGGAYGLSAGPLTSTITATAASPSDPGPIIGVSLR